MHHILEHNLCGEKSPKARLLRVLFDSIDLLALFGVYAGIIFLCGCCAFDLFVFLFGLPVLKLSRCFA